MAGVAPVAESCLSPKFFDIPVVPIWLPRCQLQTQTLRHKKASMARLQKWLRYKTYQVRDAGMGCLALLFIAVTLAFVAYFLEMEAIANRKTTPLIATITGFGMNGSKYNGGTVFVSAQDAEGLVGVIPVKAYRVAGCNVGDKIRAARFGRALTLDPPPCPIMVGQHSNQAL
jgi:hypothetical protein